MGKAKAIVLRAAGINCEQETRHALELAGADVRLVHIRRIIENPSFLEDCQLFVLPGGFSYGDDVSAGKVLAGQMTRHLQDALTKFIADGKLVLGIGNGFQVLVKTGFLPGMKEADKPSVTLTDNDSGKYENRWVYLQPATDRCVFLEPHRRIYLPTAHGEGKVVTRDKATLDKLRQEGYVALLYVDAEGKEGPFPINPNGSVGSIAGLTDSTGRVLGLMPHPERFVRQTQHPHWTRLVKSELVAEGLSIFSRAVQYIEDHF
jgi:phosphoribosylformylglycinamidine synthase